MANQTCTPQLITQALGIQATGPRTVIVPADPIIWSAETSYEYLTIVASSDFGQAYISKRDVPSGTPLTNTDYWIPAAQFNAQLAALQKQYSELSALYESLNSAMEELESTLNASIGEINKTIDDAGTVPDYMSAESAGIIDPSKGIMQDMTHAVVNPTFNGMGGCYNDLAQLAQLLGTWINASFHIGYSNINTFHYTDDGDGTFTANLPTSHASSNGYIPCDCATFTELVANNIAGNTSPLSGSGAALTSRSFKQFDYTDPNVVQYWNFMGEGEAGRMLTWQWAKYLRDRGQLITGNFAPQPGAILFFGDPSRYAEHYMGIYHCAIVTNTISDWASGESQYWVMDVGGGGRSSATSNAIAHHLLDSSHRDDIVACAYFPIQFGTQNTAYAYRQVITASSGMTHAAPSGLDSVWNATANPVTMRYKTNANGPAEDVADRGGLDVTFTLNAYQGFQFVRPESGNVVISNVTASTGTPKVIYTVTNRQNFGPANILDFAVEEV